MRRKVVNVFIYIIILASILIVPIMQVSAERHDLVFDRTQDSSRLTARFLKLVTRSNGKSGDSTILTSPEGLVMMIDGGNPTTYPEVAGALEKLGITKIDFLVASHPHVDHVGTFGRLIRTYDIGAVYTSEVVYPTSYNDDYLAAIKETGTPHIILSEGDTLWFGDDVLVEILNPAPGVEYYEGYPYNQAHFINNLSLVMKFTYGESSFLFTGDIYNDGEREIVERYGDELKSGVLKSPHHGSNTSNSNEWRATVDPEIVVMMHDYLADLFVYQRYRRAGIDTYVTSLDGTVLVSTAGDGEYRVITEHDRASDFLD